MNREERRARKFGRKRRVVIRPGERRTAIDKLNRAANDKIPQNLNWRKGKGEWESEMDEDEDEAE